MNIAVFYSLRSVEKCLIGHKGVSKTCCLLFAELSHFIYFLNRFFLFLSNEFTLLQNRFNLSSPQDQVSNFILNNSCNVMKTKFSINSVTPSLKAFLT